MSRNDISEVVLALNEVHGNSPSSSRVLVHPTAVLFHLLFRTAALLTYLLCGWVSQSFITSFLFVIFFASMDFWTVKNVTGRLLVGLRWWNYVDEKGGSHWVYESLSTEEQNRLSTTESHLFWGSLGLAEVLWVLFLLASLFTLSPRWIMVAIVCLSMNTANIVGYARCRMGAKKELSSVAKDFLSQQMVGAMLNKWGRK